MNLHYKIACFSFLLVVSLAPNSVQAQTGFNYLVGAGMADVTGPVVGVQMWGFVREDQIAEGLHLRLKSRAFIVSELDGENRLAFVTVDTGSVTHAMTREVLDRLRAEYGDLYTLQNVIISATHTHAGPGGFWHYGVESPLGGAFYKMHFDAIVNGIVASVRQAHESLAPGRIQIATGNVEDAGAQRSRTAYLNNPEAERAQYEHVTDKQMTLLRFETAEGPIGVLNWFASHPTAMTYNNKLVSGDHKGYAAQAFEQDMGNLLSAPDGFVAAFANSNCGDVTPNLNLDNTGPGKDDFETTQMIGFRQYVVAKELFANAAKNLDGPVAYRQAYVEFSDLKVRDEFTGHGTQHTCASAFGYSFAAGSTEDGGGHPLFHEGMTEQNKTTDQFVKQLFKMEEPSEEFRACHAPKPILFATGITDPPSQAQVAPISVARIGQLVLVAGPAEYTTMAGRRIRETVREALGEDGGLNRNWSSHDLTRSGDDLSSPGLHVVIAGYANGYAGYVTTYEEYQTQQYEGGHTLYGPWTLAGYRQEFHRLAKALKADETVEAGPSPRDLRGEVKSTPVPGADQAAVTVKGAGDIVEQPPRRAKRGETVEVVFATKHPGAYFPPDDPYAVIEKEEDNVWARVAYDGDWTTKCRWLADDGGVYRLTVSWSIPVNAASGKYRIGHLGDDYAGYSRPFEINE